MKKSRRTYNGVHLNKKSNTQDVVEQSLTLYHGFRNPLFGIVQLFNDSLAHCIVSIDDKRVSRNQVPLIFQFHFGDAFSKHLQLSDNFPTFLLK